MPAGPSPLRPEPPRVLLVYREADRGPARSRRLELLEELCSAGGTELVTVSSRHELPQPEGFGAVVLDGEPADRSEASWLKQLASAVERGTSLLVLLEESPSPRWLAFLGITSCVPQPGGEWFVKMAFDGSGLTRRLPDEIALAGRIVTFDSSPDGSPVLQVSIGFSDRTVMSARGLGAGRIVISGAGLDEEGLCSPDLGAIFRRALLKSGALAGRERPIGLAVLGYGPYGGMGLYHGMAAEATSGLEMIAACDFDPARRKAAEEEFPGLRPYASLPELVADDAVEVVVVATPPSSHFETTSALLQAGKHVVVEKPMCLRLSEADQLLDLARREGLSLTVHQSRRWDGDYLAVRRAVEEGLLGELFNVETFVGGFEHPCRAWHSEVTVSGGAVYDWGSHHLDWILQLMGGFPSTLVAYGHKRVWHDVTNLDQVRVRLVWADGREAEFVQSDVAGIRRPKFYLQGTKATIAGHYRAVRTERIELGLGYVDEVSHHAEAPVELRLARYETGYGLSETVLAPVRTERYGFHRNLADHLSFGEPLAVTAESARNVVALLEAAQASTDKGNVAISLPDPRL